MSASQKTCLYFAYGSNMNREQMRQRVGAVVFKATACLEHFELVFNKISSDGSVKANLAPAEADDSAVCGALFELTPAFPTACKAPR